MILTITISLTTRFYPMSSEINKSVFKLARFLVLVLNNLLLMLNTP